MLFLLLQTSTKLLVFLQQSSHFQSVVREVHCLLDTVVELLLTVSVVERKDGSQTRE